MSYVVMLDATSRTGLLCAKWANGRGEINGVPTLMFQCRSIDFETPGFLHMNAKKPGVEPAAYQLIAVPIGVVLVALRTSLPDDGAAFGFIAD